MAPKGSANRASRAKTPSAVPTDDKLGLFVEVRTDKHSFKKGQWIAALQVPCQGPKGHGTAKGIVHTQLSAQPTPYRAQDEI